MKSKEQNLKITILGCGDAFASGGRFNTCFYLNNEDHHFLVDCGASALISMKKYNVPISDIKFIILSHLHGDHFGGIPFFLLDAHYNQKRNNELSIIGPSGTKKKVNALMDLLYPGTDLNNFSYPVKFIEYEAGRTLFIEPLFITPYPVIHSKQSNPHGLRINFLEKIFAFSGDTEWTESLIDISKDADLFICESNFYNKSGPSHLDYHTIMIHKNRFSCKRLILNHLGEEMLSLKDNLEIECAEDGQVITL